jgi:hypothetical protein
MNMEQFLEWKLAGEKEVFRDNMPSATFVTTSPTRLKVGSSPGIRGGTQVTNVLCHGTARYSKPQEE